MTQTRKPFIVAHRGASAYMPENTMEAFRLAFDRFHVDMIEFDVHFSKDNVPVVIHDSRLERTTNGEGYVSQRLFKDLENLDAGYYFDPQGKKIYPERDQGIRISSLEQVLIAFPGRALGVEIKEKSEKLTHAVVHLLQKYQADKNAVVGSKHHKVSQTLHRHYPEIRRFCSQRDLFNFFLDFRAGKSPKKESGFVASMPIKIFGVRFDETKWVQYLKEKSIFILFWAFQDSKAIPELLRKGADGFVVDDPTTVGTAPTNV